MPTFTSDTEYDIDPYYYVEECSRREKTELVEILKDEGFIYNDMSDYDCSINEQTYRDNIDKLRSKYLSLSNEEIDLIEKISSRF